MPELHFSRNSVRNTVLRDEQGNPVYRIDTPFKLKNRVTTISRLACASVFSDLTSEKPSSSSAHD